MYSVVSRLQDYPSVGWLNTRLLDNSIFTIFAVIENVTANYEVSGHLYAHKVVDVLCIPLILNNINTNIRDTAGTAQVLSR